MDVQQQHPVPQGGQGQAHPILCMSQLRAPGTTCQPLSLFHQQIESILLVIPSHQCITMRMVFGHSTWMIGLEGALKCLRDGAVHFFPIF